MRGNEKRILFVCAKRSVRALMAASLLAARVRKLWDIWYTFIAKRMEYIEGLFSLNWHTSWQISILKYKDDMIDKVIHASKRRHTLLWIH